MIALFIVAAGLFIGTYLASLLFTHTTPPPIPSPEHDLMKVLWCLKKGERLIVEINGHKIEFHRHYNGKYSSILLDDPSEPPKGDDHDSQPG